VAVCTLILTLVPAPCQPTYPSPPPRFSPPPLLFAHHGNTQVQLVAWRSGVAVARDKGALLSKVMPSLFFACIMGAIYSETGHDQKSIQDKIGALFFFTINQTFGNMFAVRGRSLAHTAHPPPVMRKVEEKRREEKGRLTRNTEATVQLVTLSYHN
jgi:hypothetical protein